MACKLEKTKILGHEYTCTQMSATEAMKFKFKFANLFSTSLDSLLLMNAESSIEGIEAKLAFLVSKLACTVDPDKFIPLMKQLIGDCAKGGQRINFEQEYSGNLAEAYAVFVFALLTNYKDFFLDLLRILEELLGKKIELPGLKTKS